MKSSRTMYRTLNQILQQARLRSGMSLDDVVASIQWISRSELFEFEGGLRDLPLDKVLPLVNYFSIPTDRVMECLGDAAELVILEELKRDPIYYTLE